MKILQNINTTILIILLMIATMLIGSPILESNIQILYIALGLYSIIYFVIKIIKKEKITLNKIDLFILLLVVSSIIPLIVGTYVSLSDTIYKILKYFSILAIYLITKNEIKRNPKNKNKIIYAIIITIFILCIFGIDEINFNILENFKKLINYKMVATDEVRIGSLFSYSNAMAVVAGVGILLCLGNIIESKNITNKIINIILSIIMLITLVLTYSRLTYILFALIVFIYLIILAKKFNIIKKLNKKAKIISVIFLVLLIIYIILGLQFTEKLTVKDNYQKILYSVEADQDYILEFDVISKIQKEDNIIKITEKNKYFDDLNVTEYKIGNYNGKKQIKIHTKETTSVMYINIEVKDQQGSIELQDCKINNNNLALKYKLLPTQMVDKIKSISLKNKSAFERIVIIKDGLKLIQKNWLFGLGGNAWLTAQEGVHEYNYYCIKMHSFPIEITIENGIAGLIAFVGIIICLLKQFIKDLKNNNIKQISIFMAIALLLLHSMLDFEMSFYYVLLIFFMLISTINFEETKTEIKTKLSILLYCVLIIASIVNIYVFSVEKYYNKHTERLKVNSEWTEERIYNLYSKLLPYNSNVKTRKIRALEENNKDTTNELKNFIKTERYNNRNLSLDYIKKYVKQIIKNNQKQELKFVLSYIEGTEMFSKYKVYIQLERLQNLKEISMMIKENQIEEYINQIENQFNKELEQIENHILNSEEVRLDKEHIQNYKDKIEKIKKGEK